MTHEKKIYEIKRIINEYGEFGGDHLQVRVILKTMPNGMRQVVDAFYKDKVEVATYMGNKKVSVDYMSYDYLPDNILDEILTVAREWERTNYRNHHFGQEMPQEPRNDEDNRKPGEHDGDHGKPSGIH